ncbi:MAG: hypothetical protein FWB91_09920, partial [Defluviitaleaceae bacterium]|nr:hypothetical protein [Defluviitaleaceae bacterium]
MLKRKSKILASFLALLMVVSTITPTFAQYITEELPEQELTYEVTQEPTAAVSDAQDLGPAVAAAMAEALCISSGIITGGERVRTAADDESLAFLTSTIYQDAIGVFGFEGIYALSDNPNDMVDIMVQFRTPPAAALRLIQQHQSPSRARGGRQTDAAFAPAALAAHDRFASQLNSEPVPFG